MNNGLLSIPLRVPTEEELLMCLIVPISSDDPWDPSNLPSTDVDSTCRINAVLGEAAEPTDLRRLVQDVRIAYTLQHKGFTQESPKLLRPFLGWIPEHRVLSTIENTTRLAELDRRLPLRRHIKSRYPQLISSTASDYQKHTALILCSLIKNRLRDTHVHSSTSEKHPSIQRCMG